MPYKYESGSGALICIPTYNEASNIGQIIPAVFESVPKAHVLIIDDNSPDGTGDLADTLAQKDSRIFVLHRMRKSGLGNAYKAGFAWALDRDYQFVFELDADFSHNPRYLSRFIGLLATDQADMIIGSRRVKGGGVKNWTRTRKLISWGGSQYSRLVLGLPFRDLTGGYNGFQRKVLESIDLEGIQSNGYCFQIELKYRTCKMGFHIREEPIVFPDRVLGKSKMTADIFLEAFFHVWKLRRWQITESKSRRGTDK